MVDSVISRKLFEIVAANGSQQLNLIDGISDSTDNVVVINTTMCLFPGTTQTYMDCCTDSALKTCNFLEVMFFACFVIYGGLFYYIVTKKPWIKQHGLYINVFVF